MKTNAQKTGHTNNTNLSISSRPEATPFFRGQPKMITGQPGDKYEVEADRMADRFISRLDSPAKSFFRAGNSPGSVSESQSVQEKPLAETLTPLVQRQPVEEEEEELQARMQPLEEKEEKMQMQAEEKEELQMQEEEEEEEEMMQPKGEGDNRQKVGRNTENRLRQSTGRGSELDSRTRNEMESSFGMDFSSVKIHTDSNAVQMNRQLGAQAFTHDSDIYFNEGKYNPDTFKGKHLLVHELTHTIQQGRGGLGLKIQRATAAQSLQRIEDAASGLGTDEEGIFSAIRECTELNVLRSNPRVNTILNDELSGYDLFKAKLLVKYGNESNFPPGILLIWQATHGAGTNEELVYEAIRSSSARNRLQNSTWVQRTLRNEMSGHDYAKTQLLFRYGNESAYPSYISPLLRATEGAGTDEDLLFNTLITLTPTDITELSANSAFVNVLRSDLSGADLERFNAILSGSGPAIRDDQATSAYGAAQAGPVAVTAATDAPGTHDFSPDDVNQGEVGDCYFLASLAATANNNPGHLRNMITPQADGSYNVTLYVREGDRLRAQIVNVTARFPQYGGGTGSETYARGGDVGPAGNTEMWVRILEKAFAKLRGSYEEIHGGFESDALEAVIGSEAERIDVDDITNDDLKTRIEASFNANQPVTTATKRTSFFEDLEGAEAQFAQNNEIIGSHAYTVMAVTDDDITVRNPHGANIGNLAVRTLTWAQFRRYFSRVSTIRIEVP